MDDIRSEGQLPENLERSLAKGQRSQIVETGWNKVLSVYRIDHVGDIGGQRLEGGDLENLIAGVCNLGQWGLPVLPGFGKWGLNPRGSQPLNMDLPPCLALQNLHDWEEATAIRLAMVAAAH